MNNPHNLAGIAAGGGAQLPRSREDVDFLGHQRQLAAQRRHPVQLGTLPRGSDFINWVVVKERRRRTNRSRQDVAAA